MPGSLVSSSYTSQPTVSDSAQVIHGLGGSQEVLECTDLEMSTEGEDSISVALGKPSAIWEIFSGEATLRSLILI